jgi:hypothetical protein
MAVTYALDVLVDCGGVLLGYIDGGAGVGKIVIRDADDVLLASVNLNNPGGEVNVLTGQLQLDPAGAATAAADGIASYAEVVDSDDVVHMTIDCAEGDTAVSGYMVINALSIVTGSSVTVTSALIG